MQTVIFDLDHTLFNAEKKLHDGVADLLTILRRLGYTIAGISDGDHRILVRLDEAGVREFFNAIVCADHMPSPKVVAGLEHLLGLTDTEPHQAMLISHAHADILLGRDAGLRKIIAVTHGEAHNQSLKTSGADHIVSNIPAVLDVLG